MKQNKKFGAFFITVLFISLSAMAQSNTLAAGGDATGSDGSVSYSLGQIDYIYATGSGGSANQGVQQPFEIFEVLSTEEVNHIQVVAGVFPNPTVNNVTLVIKNVPVDDMSYHLYDMNGRMLLEQKLRDSETMIPMERFASATYFLSVVDQGSLLKTFKIIKN